jgi:hypothetical protein
MPKPGMMFVSAWVWSHSTLTAPNHEATMPEARYTLYKVLDRALVGLLILVVLVLLGLQVSHAG